MVEVTSKRVCPYCKETINARAVICHYCASGITPAATDHQGECPYCGEAIQVGALKCRHCTSILGPRMPSQLADAGSANCHALCFLHFPLDPVRQAACDAGCDFHEHLAR